MSLAGKLNKVLEDVFRVRLTYASSHRAADEIHLLSSRIEMQILEMRKLIEGVSNEMRTLDLEFRENTQNRDAKISDVMKNLEANVMQRIYHVEAQLRIPELIFGLPAALLQQRILQLASLLNPKRAIGFEKIRVGGSNDGGYIMLDDMSDIGEAFSFGIGSDVSWDLAVAARNIVVHQFDHTVSGPPANHPNFRFSPRSVAAVPAETSVTLDSLLDNSEDTRMKILKIDIEGSEWEVFEKVSPDKLCKLSQIVCEFHAFGLANQDDQFTRMKLALQKLDRVFAVVHVHANNCGTWQQLGGVVFPSILEVTYANRARYTFDECDEIFPTPLDEPNSASVPDFYLGNFKYRYLKEAAESPNSSVE